MDNVKTWTGLAVEESVRTTEDRDKWRKYVHGVADPRIEGGYRTEQNRCTMRSDEHQTSDNNNKRVPIIRGTGTPLPCVPGHFNR